MNRIVKIRLLIIASIASIYSIQAIDNAHFYRASNFFYVIQEPRLAKSWLFSCDATIGHGSTKHSEGRKGKPCVTTCKNPLLNIYGPHNMHQLGSGVPGKSITNPNDLALINLEAVPNRECFAQLLFSGEFSITECNIFVTQNLNYGFYLQAHIPIRRLIICHPDYCDLSPTDTVYPNAQTPQWTTFLRLFDSILDQYDINRECTHESGVGDISFLAGWATHYEETKVLDFFDFSVALGVLAPTGKKRNEDKAFSIPLGYNGHTGMNVHASAAFGCYGWLNIGAHAYAIIFGDKGRDMRMKTDCAQNGFITLAKGCACVEAGTLWGVNAYVKADHIIKGLSALIGYSYDRKHKDIVKPCDTEVFDPCIVNHDRMFRGWKMDTLHIIGEYDFAHCERLYGPRISVFYNHVLGGKRIFKTSVGGIGFGIDIAW